MSKLNAAEVRKAIMKWPGLYETEAGTKFFGMPVSQVPSQLRDCHWKNVSHLRRYDFREMDLEIVTARYIGGARPKRFCDVVVATYEMPSKGDTRCDEDGYKCRVVDYDPRLHVLLLSRTEPEKLS